MDGIQHQMASKYSSLCILLANLLPLLIGGCIYICLRSEDMLMFVWMDALGMKTWVVDNRSFLYAKASKLPEILVYVLPNAFWMMSYSLIMAQIWRDSPKRGVVWVFMLWFLTIVTEILQSIGRLSGTFDYADIAAYTLGALIYFLYPTSPPQPNQ